MNNGQLQKWLQQVITNPAGVVAGMQQQPALQESPVLPSATLTSAERLHIYHSAYYSRLLACLRTEYACLCSAISQEVFDQFALAFIQNHPPSSFTLFDLSKSFPGFLQSTRPVDNENENQDRWPEFMIDLAHLERANNEVYNGAGAEQAELMTLQDFMQIPPFELDQWKIKSVPCLQLFEFNFPVQQFFINHHQGNTDDPIPEPQNTFLAINRINYRVRFFELEKNEYAFLQLMLQGIPFGKSIDQLCESPNLSRREVKRKARSWITRWTQQEFLLRR